MLQVKHLLFSSFIIFTLILVDIGVASASFQVDKNTLLNKRSMSIDEREYLDILFHSHFDNFDMSVPFYKRWQKYCDLYIKAFEVFIKKYPKSTFVPEAKLRIAERYHISYRKSRARRWLDDLIINHPNDRHYSSRKKYVGSEWTAAWALYYRGKWFNEKDDFEKIKIRYPGSRVLEEKSIDAVDKILIKPLYPPPRK